jgi:deoxyribodipyrimidine photo-lyase
MSSLFIFTRDLRLEDNTGLIMALKNSNNVIPAFIFDSNQISEANSYKSNNCVQFMMESLNELNESLEEKGSRLFYFYTSDYEKTIINIIKKSNKYEIKSIYISMDYTPFAKKRQNLLKKICDKLNLDLYVIEDHMLTGYDDVKKNDGTYYVKFTPYYRAALKHKINSPVKNKYKNYVKKSYKIDGEFDGKKESFYKENNNIMVRGGRSNALRILKKIKNYKDYNTEREIPSHNGTTKLSAYMKFNVISIREVYETFKDSLLKSNKLITQLYWRDFYMQIMNNFEILKQPTNKEYNIKWENNPTYIKKWKTGTTGIPIIDAAMNEMNTTGWMHNRCRMIVSNFLIKILRCDWMIGEKYFAQSLVDYDYSNNKGGWLWNCGSKNLSGLSFSLDSQPFFRVFNPWRQAENFDPECEYIKKWIPQLKDVPNKDILKWDETYQNYKKIDYPKPIVDDIQAEFKKTLNLIKTE